MSRDPAAAAHEDPAFDPSRDRLLRGATVVTLDDARPRAAAVAVRGGRLLAVGDEAEVRARVADDVETIDLDGAVIVPGLHDAHVHLASHGLEGLQVRLGGTASFAEAIDRIRDEAPDGDGWILGSGYAEQRWPEPPDRAALDAAVPDRPVLVRSQDHHSAIANGKALRRAGIVADTPDPDDGRIERRADGTPNGVLRERAVDLLLRTVPDPGPDGWAEALRHGARRMAALGVTTVHHMAYESPSAARAVADAAADEAFPLRVWACLPQQEIEAAAALGLATGQGGGRHRIGGAKFFVDGALGSLTSWMLEPYLGTDDAGMRVIDLDELHERVGRAVEAGLAPVAHAIGDAAVRAIVDVYEAHEPAWRAAGLRPRIEHAQHVHERDVARIGRMGLVASVQPLHLVFDAPTIRERLTDREDRAYPMRSLLEAGAVLAFGSDTPVAPPDAVAAMRTAHDRIGQDGRPVAAHEALTPLQALIASTRGAAHAIGAEGRSGRIRAGHDADLTILNADPTERVDDATRVVATMVGGRFSYRA